MEEQERAIARRVAREALGVRRPLDPLRAGRALQRLDDGDLVVLGARAAVLRGPALRPGAELCDHDELRLLGELRECGPCVDDVGTGRGGERRERRGEERVREEPHRAARYGFAWSSSSPISPRSSGSAAGPMLFWKIVSQMPIRPCGGSLL
jgi:hypothetical protein